MVTPTGAERMFFEVLMALRARGAAVHCVLNDWANEQIIPMAERAGASWSAGGYRVRFDRHTRDVRAVGRQVRDIVRTSVHLAAQAIRFRPTHVLLQEHATVIRNYPTLILLRLLGVPCIMQLCNAPDESPFYRRLWRRVVDPLVTRYVCNSRFTVREVVACGISPRKTSLISNIVPTRPVNRGTVTRNARRVIFVGQVIPPKGLHVLLEAIALLVQRKVEVSLDVVGRVDGWISPVYGDYWERLKARVAAPDLAGRVGLLGWREDVDVLMQGAAVHCCPSLPEQRETFGIVVLEAKTAGLPSVVFESGALAEQITHSVDGWVCPEWTAAALADGIEYFLSDADRLKRAGERARESASRYDRTTSDEAWWALVSPAAPARSSSFASAPSPSDTRA
jgi:glycosyltransferase involved in cell wall biosynthesis